MQKHILVFTALLLWAMLQGPAAVAQHMQDYVSELYSERDNASERSLKGKVQSVKTIYSTIDRNTGHRSLHRQTPAHMELFDKDGNLIAYAGYQGKPVYFPMLPGEMEHLKYVKGVLRERSDYKRTRYELYDKHGEFIESWSVEEGVPKMDQMAELSYNWKNLLLERKLFWVDSLDKDLREHTVYTYDDKKRLIRERTSGGLINMNIPVNPNAETVVDYEYDDEGNQTKISINSGGMLGKREVNSYYLDGELREIETIAGGRRTRFSMEDGRITHKLIRDSSHNMAYESRQEYLYEFDDQGNWIKLNIYVVESSRNHSAPIQRHFYIEREISYHP